MCLIILRAHQLFNQVKTYIKNKENNALDNLRSTLYC